MAEDSTRVLGDIFHIHDKRIQDHFSKIVRGAVEEALMEI